MEELFWDADHGAYADERDQTLNILSHYRGQMLTCMPLRHCSPYESTNETRYLDRASIISQKFTVAMTGLTNGQIWEHYTTDWQHDWYYNIDKPDDLFKPWGYQPGHQVEWAKLLLQLNRHQPAEWHLDRAVGFSIAQWKRDGTRFTVDWSMAMRQITVSAMPINISGSGRGYSGIQRLFSVTGKSYRQHYSSVAMVLGPSCRSQHSAWFRIVTRDGQWMEPYKSASKSIIIRLVPVTTFSMR